MEKFIMGALLGGVAGALAVANNAKMRMLVKKGEDELKEKVSATVDEKLSAMLKKYDEMKNAAQAEQGAQGAQGAQKAQGGEETQSEEREGAAQSGDAETKKKSKKKETKKS